MRGVDELRTLIEGALDRLTLTAELGGLHEAMRYAYEAGGKRIRPLLCLATTEAAGRPEPAAHRRREERPGLEPVQRGKVGVVAGDVAVLAADHPQRRLRQLSRDRAARIGE